MIGMHEVGMQPRWPYRQSGQQRVRPVHCQRIPAHVGNLEFGPFGCDQFNRARDPAEALRHIMLKALACHQLHADANAEKGLGPADDFVFQRFPHAGQGLQPVAAILESADAWKNDALRSPDFGGIGCDNNRH